MVDIVHKVGVKSSPDDVYAALTTRDGLAGWWTEETTGQSDVGGVLEFMHHCSTKWATYLMSLKQLVETGTGASHPHDVKIDSWD